MLFYIKKHPALELLTTLVLAGLGAWGIRRTGLVVRLDATFEAALFGIGGFLFLTIWNLGVQTGYRLAKGPATAEALTTSLAKEFADASVIQILLGGVAAAAEEVFFRGFLQGAWGLAAGTIAFGLAHIGRRDIRVVSYWSFAQGFWLGALYLVTENLLVPMIAHGLFDIGGFAYFRIFMKRRAA